MSTPISEPEIDIRSLIGEWAGGLRASTPFDPATGLASVAAPPPE